MRLPARSALLALLILPVITFGLGWFRRDSPKPPPLSVSLWYWHQPFQVRPDEQACLKRMGVTELFVRAATLTFQDKPDRPVRVLLPQQWKTSSFPLPVHLVFPADYSLVRRFEKIPEGTLRTALAVVIRAERNRAEGAGLQVAGVQLDFDCPTRLLPRYARLLRSLKEDLGSCLSITLLTSWYASQELQGVLDAIDFSVPQFYEAETGRTRDTFAPISDMRRLERGLKSAAKFRRPFLVGIPAYGHAMVYDGAGKLRGLFHDAGADELLNRPEEFRLIANTPLDRKGKPATNPDTTTGEELIEFGAVPGRSDFRLVYDLPTPELVKRHMERIRAAQPINCQGIVLYRFPEPRETQSLPLVTLEALLRGESPQPNLTVRLRTRRRAPYQLIEAENPESIRQVLNVYADVTNSGNGPTRIAPDAVEVTLTVANATLDGANPGGFDKLTTFSGSPDNRASISRADGIQAQTIYLSPGESRTLGPISLYVTDRANIRGNWRVAVPGGFSTITGEIPDTVLSRPDSEPEDQSP